MLLSLLLWKVSKITYLSAFLMAFILLAVQIFRLSSLIFGLPAESSLPFIGVWFAYYSFFFIPDGLLIATAITAYELKEKKLTHVLYSFHLSPYRLMRLFLAPALLFLLICGSLTPFLVEEHVTFATRGLLIQYKDRLFENIPIKTFLRAGNLVVYVRNKEGNKLEGVFLKYKNLQVIAEKATYLGKGNFVFEKGSLLTREEGKYFLMKFEKYNLSTEEFLRADLREEVILRDRLLNIINTAFILPLSLLGFVGSLKLCKSHTQLYLMIAGGFILHQIVMFVSKLNL